LEHRRSLEKLDKQAIKNHLLAAFRRRMPPKVKGEDVEAAIEGMVEAREIGSDVLMWSYAHAFFMGEGTAGLRLFEFVQREAEKAMDKFCWLLEVQKSFAAGRMMTAGALVTRTIETLLKHVDGYS
jgi:hypothetical protein